MFSTYQIYHNIRTMRKRGKDRMEALEMGIFWNDMKAEAWDRCESKRR